MIHHKYGFSALRSARDRTVQSVSGDRNLILNSATGTHQLFSGLLACKKPFYSA
jgi:hypothetical protein